MSVVARAPRPEPDDATLVAAAQAGDRTAFTRLFRRHVDRVRSLLTRLIGPTPERDDLVQQVFLALHRALPTYRGDAALTTYLHRIAVNAAFDHLRERRRGRLEPLDPAALDLLVGPDARDRAAARAELALLFAALDHLSARQRVAFVLVAVEGLSLAEAATLLDATPDAVKQRVLAARRELATILDEEHDDE